jgi:hypothetical protein
MKSGVCENASRVRFRSLPQEVKIFLEIRYEYFYISWLLSRSQSWILQIFRFRFLATGLRSEKTAFKTDAKLLPFKKKCLCITQDTWRILTPTAQTLIMKTPEDKTQEEKSRTVGASGKAKGRKGSSLLLKEKPFHLGCDLWNIFIAVMSHSISSSLSGVSKGEPHFRVWLKR